MARSSALCLVLACLALVFAAASATQFRVGGKKGWSVPDAGFEPYNTWAGRMRFQIGDQLLFVYPKETDSVLLVEPAAYNACNVSSYVQKFTDGNTVFTFDRSGPFFFISGNEASCRANEKLIVVVLADRSGGGTRTPPPSSSPPAPSSSPPAAAPTLRPSSSPPPGAAPPVPAPAATPTTSPPSPSPAASAPAPAPTTTTPSSPPPPMAPSPSTTPTPGGASQPPSASANAPGAGGNTTPPPPPSASGRSAAAAPAVAGMVGTLGAFIGYAVLAA